MTDDAPLEPSLNATLPLLPGTGERIELMLTFLRIVEAGSLSAAASQLGTTQPTVSRRLQMLERALGLRLLQRTTHTMRLTHDGERCYERAKELLAGWARFESELKGAREEPEGILRVIVPHAFGQERLIGPLSRYLQQHAGMAVEWLLHDDRAIQDYIAAGIDCAIQVGELTDPGMVAIPLGQVPRIVVASPELLAGRPVPQDAAELIDLPWLALRTFYRNEVLLTHATSHKRKRIPIKPRFSTDSLYALRSAAIQGLGVGLGSRWVMTEALKSGQLIQLTPAWQAAPLPVNLVYPYARFYPARLRRFIDIVRAEAGAMFGVE
ncbi:MAG: LysR family transcriptional regulator [Paludibacterium sp.]|uniref:LysR family transcriptional regulator n=1 Tax=Paludibacterium sp. TaxID=1917523 RepID=UPI0025D1A8E9|nr:LysR family transcriptional regulator [Paludibacterium sp.]MBV8048732.1 LysR family transcriptional regulator [Paludibacterium sp.]MBV8648981.1 LysR family transcriptional regulator [Paludibacterium sp.]